MKRTFWLIFWLLVGMIVGSLLAGLCSGIPALSWLAYGQSIRFAPAADWVVVKFDLDLSISLNLAEIICILASMFCYRHFKF